jgi:hypothetical protein
MSGGEIRRLGRFWTKGQSVPNGVASRYNADTFFGSGDVWREMLIELTGPGGGQLSLDRMLDAAEGSVRANREVLDGRDCVRLRHTHTIGKTTKEQVTQWHDVGRNYLISKIVVEYPNDREDSRGVLQVTDWTEPIPGVIFPTQVRAEHTSKGAVYSATVTTLSNVVINKPVPASALALPSPPRGTVLSDHIDNLEGPIDSDWKPIGKLKTLSQQPILRPQEAPRAQPAESTQSGSEPTSSARWVLIGSVAILLTVAGLVIGRRVRAARQTT